MVRIQNVDWEVGIKEVADKSVDLLLTDPPYGMEFQSNHRKVKHKRIQNDNNLDWLVGWVDELKRDSNILKADKTGNVNHPTEKPLNLISYLINKSTNIGDLVLDTFGGSCVTAIASKQLQRNCICFEIEESYCKNAQTRLSATDGLLF